MKFFNKKPQTVVMAIPAAEIKPPVEPIKEEPSPIEKMSPELARRVGFFLFLKEEGMSFEEIKWLIGPEGTYLV